MIWGGKYDYATWFGANPTFIYGIQWLPNNEYLTSYALNETEKQTLTNIFVTYMQAKDNTIDTWFANMWTIQAIVDSEKALTMFDANKILNDDYPTDLSHTYYLIHGIHHFGDRETSYRMVIHEAVSSSIYQNDDGDIIAIVWNPTNEKANRHIYLSNRVTNNKISECKRINYITIIKKRRSLDRFFISPNKQDDNRTYYNNFRS